MRYAFLLIFVLTAQAAVCQDMTGIWRGSFKSSDKLLDMFNIEDRYKLEVQVDQINKQFKGVTYSYKTTVFYGKASANGTVNPKTGKVFLQELKIVEVKMQESSFACVMTYFLQYSKSGNEEFLEGTYTSFRENDSTSCGKGTVYLRKVTTSDFYKEPFLVKREEEKNKKKLTPTVTTKKLTAPLVAKNTTPKATTKRPLPGKAPDTVKKSVNPPIAKTPPRTTPGTVNKVTTKPQPRTAQKVPPSTSNKPSENKTEPGIAKTDTSLKEPEIVKKPVTINVPKVLITRENELVKTVTINSNEVSINIYDNGTIDHDTVSVYLDKKLVVSKQMLTTSPITIHLKLDEENAYHELVMVAENLGDIPPNTSLMVVKAGDKIYEVRITSTEQKNAVVIFKYEKP